MSRSKGTANLAASLEVLAGAPLDAREKVPTKADLYIAANFPYPYVGLETYVVAENKKYRLVGNDVTVEANWEEIGSGGGGGTTVVANPEGEATDELEKLQVGNDIYSIPEENVEINKDQFDALPAATKNNGKAYFIPDANILTNFTVMGNRFDKANIYDTTERMVGRWIDGKPLYQKVISKTVSVGANNTITVEDLSSLNIDTICKVDSTFFASGEGTYVIPEKSNRILIDSSKALKFNANTAWSGTMSVTIQYTKTTDASIAIGTENDYSTDEMIIGTWIDGKPIYQITLSGLSFLGTQNTMTNVTSSKTPFEETCNIDNIISHKAVRSSDHNSYSGFSLKYTDGRLKYFTQAIYPGTDILYIQYTKTTD